MQTKTKRNEVFLRGGRKKTKCSITKKRNVDIPSKNVRHAKKLVDISVIGILTSYVF